MEPVEDAERQRKPLHDRPRHKTVEIQLHRVRLHFLCLERVDDPHRHIANEQERHHLTARLRTVVLRQMHPTTRHVRNEEQLKYHLERERIGEIFFFYILLF